MAEASIIRDTTDSVDGESSLWHVGSDELIDPYCETCFENKNKKIGEVCFCENCNLYMCIQCHDVHKQMHFSQKHRVLRGSKMPKSLADKPVKYSNCELHIDSINDRYCLKHHVMLCSECLKQNHQRCHVDTITDLCKNLGTDDIKSFTAVVSKIKLNLQNTQTKLKTNISDLTKERENEIKRAEQAKQDMIQKANEMFNNTVSGITKSYHNKECKIKSTIVELTEELNTLDEIINKLNRKVSIKFDPNLFIQMQQIVDTTQACKREINDTISEIKTTQISFSLSKEISAFLSCKRFGDVQEMSSPLSITDDVGDIFFPYITSQTKRTKLVKKVAVDISHIVARKMSHMYIRSSKDGNQPNVNALAVTNNGTLLVSDANNGILKVFTQDSTLLSSVPLSDGCWDVTVTEDDIAVVSTDYKKLHFLDISDPSLASVQWSVSLGYTALGITTYKDKLVVTACTTPPSVRMINTNGKEIWSVTKGLDDEQLFVTPCFIVTSKINDTETVIVSDCRKETLTLLNANNGSLLKIVNMKGKCPYGITVDNNGNIFVACGIRSEICVWSNDFTKSRTLISKKDLDLAPCYIAYSSSTDTLYISHGDYYDYIEIFQPSIVDQ